MNGHRQPHAFHPSLRGIFERTCLPWQPHPSINPIFCARYRSRLLTVGGIHEAFDSVLSSGIVRAGKATRCAGERVRDLFSTMGATRRRNINYVNYQSDETVQRVERAKWVSLVTIALPYGADNASPGRGTRVLHTWMFSYCAPPNWFNRPAWIYAPKFSWDENPTQWREHT